MHRISCSLGLPGLYADERIWRELGRPGGLEPPVAGAVGRIVRLVQDLEDLEGSPRPAKTARLDPDRPVDAPLRKRPRGGRALPWPPPEPSSSEVLDGARALHALAASKLREPEGQLLAVLDAKSVVFWING